MELTGSTLGSHKPATSPTPSKHQLSLGLDSFRPRVEAFRARGREREGGRERIAYKFHQSFITSTPKRESYKVTCVPGFCTVPGHLSLLHLECLGRREMHFLPSVSSVVTCQLVV